VARFDTRFTFGPGLNEIPVWSPDGKRIAYGSSQKLNFEKDADGSGAERDIADFGPQTRGVGDWSRDDKYVLAWKDKELWSLALPDFQAKPYLQTGLTSRLPKRFMRPCDLRERSSRKAFLNLAAVLLDATGLQSEPQVVSIALGLRRSPPPRKDQARRI
jgi:hypothetical protein